MFFQNTIKKQVELKGVGIHTGINSNVLLLPAPINTGIVFIPWGKELAEGIRAHIDNLLLLLHIHEKPT